MFKYWSNTYRQEGATSEQGFGAHLVSNALSRGDLVIATGRSQNKLDKILEKHENTENLRVLQLDVTSNPTTVRDVVNQAVGFWGRIDVAVNNAGNGELGLIEETDTSAIRHQFETNLFGPVEVVKAILPHMRSRRSGTIVFLGSRSVWIGETPGLAHYSASKAAMHAMAEGLASEVSHLGIRVLLLAPGAFRTNIYASSPFHQENSIPDYDGLRAACIQRFKGIAGHEPGDPVKAMQILVDVVRGEGVAVGKKWPEPGTSLLLGNDAERDLYKRFDKLKAAVLEWADVVRSVWYPINVNTIASEYYVE
ncbi:NAD-P-binding protein [Lentinula guzmanii]|uniref:NAD-P-binding protein n=1 Tax=Lentinula guzmanii TaxID=2804957 RepID=A0AA38N0P6_9AGAR|nr:NAD-P-binding protein [Lentinula guzmanii]